MIGWGSQAGHRGSNWTWNNGPEFLEQTPDPSRQTVFTADLTF
jgi:hypothetical protein